MNNLFARKALDAWNQGSSQSLTRALGTLDLVLLGVGTILGTGIFVVTGRAAAANAGPAVAVSFLMAGIAAGLSALCYAEMASMIPSSGSAYAYAYATLGEVVAFVLGWCLILGYGLSSSLVGVGWSGYLIALIQRLFGVTLSPRWTSAPMAWDLQSHSIVATGAVLNVPAALLCLVVTVLLARGMKRSANFSSAVVAIKLAAILLFLVFAAQHMSWANFQPFLPDNTGKFGQFGWSGLMQGTTMVYVAYIGFDAVSTAAQETKNPQSSVPIGIILPVLVCTLLYIAVAVVLCGVVPYQLLSVPHPLALGVSATGREWLATVVTLGAVLGLAANSIGVLMAQARVILAMGSDGLLPQALARVHPVYHTPHVATFVGGVACALCAGLLPIDILGELISVGTLLAFLMVSVGVIVLRIKRPEVPRRFKVWGGTYLVPGTSALFSAVLILTATEAAIFRLTIWIALGLVVYAFYGRRYSHLRLENARKSLAAQEN